MKCPRCDSPVRLPHLSLDACLAALLEERERWRRRALTLEIEGENDPARSKQLTRERDRVDER